MEKTLKNIMILIIFQSCIWKIETDYKKFNKKNYLNKKKDWRFKNLFHLEAMILTEWIISRQIQ